MIGMTTHSDPRRPDQPGHRTPPRPEVWSPPRAPGRRPGYARPPIPDQRPASDEPTTILPRLDDRPVPEGAPAPMPQWWERYLARAIDTALYVVGYLILSGVVAGILFSGFGVFGRLGYTLVAVIPTVLAGVAYAYYDHHMHVHRDGQTLGKKALQLRLVAADGGPPDPAAVRKRAMIYPGVTAPLGLLGLVSALAGLLPTLAAAVTVIVGIGILTDEPLRRALHDRWAGTRVIKAE